MGELRKQDGSKEERETSTPKQGKGEEEEHTVQKTQHSYKPHFCNLTSASSTRL